MNTKSLAQALGLLSLATLALALSACGGGGDSGTSTDTSVASLPETADADSTQREDAMAVAGSLIGRAWSPPQLLEYDTNPVTEQVSGIDDAGHVTVVYRKTTSTRDVLYATRGTPGATGSSPVFGAPVVIDTRAGVALTSLADTLHLATAPNGNAVAVWSSKAPCGPATYNTTGTCIYLQSARYLAANGRWDAPVQVVSTPNEAAELVINERGDVAIKFTGWVRRGSSSYTGNYSAVAWKAAGRTAFTQRVFVDGLSSARLAMDNTGHLTVAGATSKNTPKGTVTDVQAYRGNVTEGLGVRETLASDIGLYGFLDLAMGLNGQTVLLWKGGADNPGKVVAATATTVAAAFKITPLTLPSNALTATVVTDAGIILVYDAPGGNIWRWSANVWTVAPKMPLAGNGRPGPGMTFAFARNGNFLAVQMGAFGLYGSRNGLWASYDASRNVFVQPLAGTTPGKGFVLGVTTGNSSLGMATPMLSTSGIGAITMKNVYSPQPSPSVPHGVKGTINNLWGTYLK